MKKRLLSLLLILCLCAALLPAAVFAEDNVIELNQKKLETLLGNASLINASSFAYSYKDPLPAGSYRLTDDVITLKASIVIKGNVTLDLNGNRIEMHGTDALCSAIRVIGENASLTLTDSSKEKNGAIRGFQTGSQEIDEKNVSAMGGGVYINGGSFIMNGGTIDSCSGRSGGGGVYLTNGASFTMNAGTIKGCTAQEYASGGGVYVDSDCTFIMEDGAIDSCTSASGAAGGVYVGGTFRMTGGTIRNCTTADNNGNGGGVFVAGGGTFEMTDGSIEDCYTWINGGGVYVNTNGTFTMTGGTIKNNVVNKDWGGEGAGVYVADGANATLITSNITGNTKTGGEEDNITAPGGYKEYEPPVDPIDPDYPLISILPALTKDLPFADVTSADWFYSDVKYAYETGLMTGTSADAFSPEAPVTRGMVMTILARREGIRTDRYTPWYAAGCEWAKANGISDGTNPEAPVTREQLAAMLYRYAALKGRDLTAGENLNFTDASDVSAYALSALQWATGEKILTGSNGALNPQAPATRAHLAAILHRYFG